MFVVYVCLFLASQVRCMYVCLFLASQVRCMYLCVFAAALTGEVSHSDLFDQAVSVSLLLLAYAPLWLEGCQPL